MLLNFGYYFIFLTCFPCQLARLSSSTDAMLSRETFNINIGLLYKFNIRSMLNEYTIEL